MSVRAQCSFEVSAIQEKESDCQSNGIVKATLYGDDVDNGNIQTYDAQYLITSTVPGGYGTSSFSTNDGILTDVPPGTYIVEARAYCKITNKWEYKKSGVVTVTGSYIVPDINRIFVVTADIKKSLRCEPTGSVPIHVEGGKPPYTISIVDKPANYDGPLSFDSISPGIYTIYNLPAGVYSFRIRDDCTYTYTIPLPGIVEEIIPIFKIEETTPARTCVDEGTITVSAKDGLEPYKVIITQAPGGYNIPDTTRLSMSGSVTLDNLPAGQYTITVVDSCGYFETLKPVVKEIRPEAVIENIHQSIACNASGLVEIDIKNGVPPYKITLSETPPAYSGEISFIQDDSGIFKLDNLPAGEYKFEITDGCGYDFKVTASIEINSLKLNALTSTESQSCLSTGSILFNTISGGLAPYRIDITSAPAEYIDDVLFDPVNAGNFAIYDVPVGEYFFKITDQCGDILEESVFVDSLKLEVDIVIKSSFNCLNNGEFAIYVSGGTPPYKVIIDEAPAGYGIVPDTFNLYEPGMVPVKNLPSGDYTIIVVDYCKMRDTFYIKKENMLAYERDIPEDPFYEYFFPPTNTDAACQDVRVKLNDAEGFLSGYWNSDNPEKYYEAAFFLGGTTPPNPLPWQPVTKEFIDYTLPETYKEMRDNKHFLVAIVRLKDDDVCSLPVYDTIRLDIVESIVHAPKGQSCDGFSLAFEQRTDEKGVFCYPYDWELRDSIGGVVKWGKGIDTHKTQTISNIMPYGKYTLHFTDKEGYTWHTDTIKSYWRNSSQATIAYSDFACDTYTVEFKDDNICKPYAWKLFKPDNTIFASGSDIYDNDMQSVSLLQYNVVYKLQLIDNNNDIFEYKIEQGKEFFSNYAISSVALKCAPDLGKGHMKIHRTGVGNDLIFPVGTQIKYISGPTVPAHTDITLDNTQFDLSEIYPFSSDSIVFQHDLYIEQGLYKFEIIDSCDIAHSVEINYEVYSASEFTYEKEETCAGAKIYPKGSIYLGKTKQTAYFRVRSAPPGIAVNDSAITEGQFISLPESGTYVIQMSANNDKNSCPIDTLIIEYSKKSVELDKNATKAYICDEGSPGYIYVQAIGGVGPYTYDLIDDGVEIMTSYTGSFSYGKLGESYIIRINDLGCNVSFEQRITMLDLSKERLIYGTEDVCFGSTIELNCVSISNDYEWTGPNGFISYEQNPLIDSATFEHEGVYTVIIRPEGCLKTIQQDLEINVHQPDTPEGDTVRIQCLNSPSMPMSVEPSAGHIIQWYDTDGKTRLLEPPTPKTDKVDTITYYVSQISDDALKCESEKRPIVAIISDLPIMAAGPEAPDICTGVIPEIILPKTDSAYIYNVYTEKIGGELVNSAISIGDTVFIQGNVALTNSTTYYIEVLNDNQCPILERIPVYINVVQPPPAPNAEPVNIICLHSHVDPLVAIALGDHHLQWYDTDGLTPLSEAPVPYTDRVDTVVYYVTQISDNMDCESVMKPVTVIVSDLPNKISDADAPDICPASKPVVIISNTYKGYTYNLYTEKTGGKFLLGATGNGNVLHLQTDTALTASTSFYIEIINEYGCVGLERTPVAVTVVNPPPVPEAKGVDIQCLHSPSHPLTATALPGHHLQWYDAGKRPLSDAPSPSTDKVDTITYYVTQLSDDLNCESEMLSVQAIIRDLPGIVNNASAPDICPGMYPVVNIPKSYEDYEYKIYTSATGGELVGEMLGTGSALEIATSLSVMSSTNYYVEVVNESQCRGLERTAVTINVTNYLYINPDALPSYERGIAYRVQLETNAVPPYVFTALQSLPLGFELSELGEITGTAPTNGKIDPMPFTVQVVDSDGCIAIKEYELTSDIFIPQAFTPNGDGVNDHFMKGKRLIIFDRLGIKIFEGSDGWDGTRNGQPAPADTYFYVIFHMDDSGFESHKTGYITILRRQ
ncbi:MAG: gliding motility-associated C-terminal domain-containing protein [Prevotellaceae bacterium]|jgi:gliding motility-associated-like protein|nr:gliding motility-associated C-terminal domain-containing protein [Prevotellaceae bacterium]